jgi:DNA-binding transcriptional ArsR family regulator
MGARADVLDARFAALADPTRRAILARLAEGEANVTELAAPFTMSQPAITKHLKVLERAGLVSRGRDAQRRPCRLRGEGIRPVVEWTEDYREFWDESYDRLDEYLEELKSKKRTERKERKHGRKKQ